MQQGLLDKHGRENARTPKGWKEGYKDLTPKTVKAEGNGAGATAEASAPAVEGSAKAEASTEGGVGGEGHEKKKKKKKKDKQVRPARFLCSLCGFFVASDGNFGALVGGDTRGVCALYGYFNIP